MSSLIPGADTVAYGEPERREALRARRPPVGVGVHEQLGARA